MFKTKNTDIGRRYLIVRPSVISLDKKPGLVIVSHSDLKNLLSEKVTATITLLRNFLNDRSEG